MSGRGRRRAHVPRSRTSLALVLVAALGIVVTLAATALVGPTEDRRPDGAATDRATGGRAPSGDLAAADVDLSNLPVSRTPDCDVVDDDAVAEALGAPVTLRDHYRSGDRVEVVPGVVDLVHENACVFRAPSSAARVWVFAAPVSTAYATDLVRETRRRPGCEPRRQTTAFGDPTTTDVCTSRTPRTVTATLRGLFGDAWLSCSVEQRDGSPDDVLRRADRWCVHVATTLGARP